MAAADRGLLSNRAFLAIWGAQILSQVAANAVTSALIILVAEITHSNTSSSFLILLAVLPAILFGIAGGVIVDRSDRRLVLIITNALRAAAVVPLLLFGTGLTVVYLVNFLVATVTIFFVPAEAALLPKIVGHRFLMVANSLFTFTFNGAFLVGFIILAPIVVSLFGYEILWVLIAFMFAAASILCVTLPRAPPASEHLSRRVAEMAVAQTATGITEAFHYLRQAPIVTWSLIYIALTYTLVAVAGALAPGFVREVLRVGERNVVIIVAPAGVGVIAGLGVLNAIGRRWPRPNAIGTGLIVALSALLFLAAARPLTDFFSRAGSPGLGAAFPVFVAVVAGTAFVFGVSYALITVPAMTLLQRKLQLVIGIGCAAATALASVVPPRFIGAIIDSLQKGTTFETVVLLALGSVGFSAGEAIFRGIARYLLLNLARQAEYEMRNDLF